MSPQVFRVLAALLLLAHGLGHALTALPLFGIRLSASHASTSWLLDGVAGPRAISTVCVGLNLLALLLFVGAGLGVAGWGVPRESWGRLAVLGGSVSLLALVLFWNAFPFLFPNKVGVMAIDLWAIGSVLWLRWPAGLFDA